MKLTLVKTITAHRSLVNSIILLQDGRIASGDDDYTIKIFDPNNNYNCDLTILHSSQVKTLCQLDNGNIVSSGYSYMSLWSFSKTSSKFEHNYKKTSSTKVISISNNRFVTVEPISIWNGDSPYSEQPIKVLENKREFASSVTYIRDKEYLIAATHYSYIMYIWSTKTYQCISTIKGPSARFRHCLYNIDNKRVAAGADGQFFIVNVIKGFVEDKIILPKIGVTYDFVKLKCDVLMGAGNYGKYVLYNLKSKELVEIQSEHRDIISDLVRVNENTIATCSNDHTIRIYKEENF